MTEKEGKADAQPFHLILLAKDYVGYRNLCRLVTDAHVDGYYYKPRIDREHLARYAEGLVGLSAPASAARSRGRSRSTTGTAPGGSPASTATSSARATSSSSSRTTACPSSGSSTRSCSGSRPETGLPLVVTNDLHYVHEAQADAHDVLLCVGTGNNIDTPGRMKFETRDFWLKSAAQMAALFPDQPEAILNTRRIAEMTDLELPLGQLRIPHFPVPDGETAESWLRKECERGLAERYGTVTPELQARLDYELGVILSMGYAGYFLIVADFVRFAREQRIQTTCRGSAPGSIVTYTLGITPVDPIAYELPFERFLNPDRVTMPDIDVDFEDEPARRGHRLRHPQVRRRPRRPDHHVRHDARPGRDPRRRPGARPQLRRGRPDREGRPEPARDQARRGARDVAGAHAAMVDGDPAVKRIIDFARQLEGVARNASTHAAGVVISREPLTELMPLQKATNSDALMTQYEMHGIEALGLLKFDFLGLSNLTILRQAVDLVRQERGDRDRPRHDPARRRDDVRAPRLGRDDRHLPAGVGGHAPLHPRPPARRRSYDLAAMVALYRPGPMDNIPAYIRRKHGQEKVTYLHPLLEPYLEKTYGIFVYQEDIMSAAIALGGFTGPEADTLGYAIRKKKSSVLRAQKREVRHPGRRARRRAAGHRPGLRRLPAVRALRLQQGPRHVLRADRLPDRLSQGELHGRVHDGGPDGLPLERGEGRRRDRRVPPDGDRGPAAGRPPLRTSSSPSRARRSGSGCWRSRTSARARSSRSSPRAQEGGPFRSLTDFCSRIDLRLVNRKVLEALARVGALNAFGHPAQILLGLDDAIAAGQAAQRDRITGQTSLFDLGADDATALERPLPQTTEVPVRERLRWEKELLGLYLSEHPMGEVAEQVGAVRHRLQRRPQGRVARRPAGRGRRDRHRLPDGHHEGERRRWASRRSRTSRARSRSSSSRRLYEQTRGDLDRGRDPARRRPDRPPRRGGLAAGRPRRRLGRRRHARTGGVRPRGRGRRSRAAAPRRADRSGRAGGGNGNGVGIGRGSGRAAGDRRSARDGRDRSRRSSARRRVPGPDPAAGGRGRAAPRPRRDPPGVPRVSPLRAEAPAGLAGAAAGSPRPSRSRPTTSRRGSRCGRSAAPSADDEPALPDEARARAAAGSQAPTPQVESQPDQVLHVRFGGATSGPARRSRWRRSRALLRERPGGDPRRPPRARRRAGGGVAADGAQPAASPTTPSSWPRSVAGSARASSTCSLG